jgi:hypothetical protein
MPCWSQCSRFNHLDCIRWMVQTMKPNTDGSDSCWVKVSVITTRKRFQTILVLESRLCGGYMLAKRAGFNSWSRLKLCFKILKVTVTCPHSATHNKRHALTLPCSISLSDTVLLNEAWCPVTLCLVNAGLVIMLPASDALQEATPSVDPCKVLSAPP